jgi:multiple sugar transport system permease protein
MSVQTTAPRPNAREREGSNRDRSIGLYQLRRRIGATLYYVIVTALAIIYLIPLGWVLSTSFRTSANVFDPTQWIPHPFTVAHYPGVFQDLPNLGTYFFNTVRIAVLTTAGQLLSCSMAGYALARLRFPGRGVVFFILLLTLMVPGQVTIIPVYVLFRTLGWINTPLPMIVPAFFGNAFATFFFRQFFMGIPRELEEAAFLDGASRWRIYRSIIVPVSKPPFMALGLITFVNGWNSYFNAAVFLQTENQWILTQGLLSLIGQYASQWGEIMAGVVLMSLPIFVLYLVVQRHFVQGFTFAGITG